METPENERTIDYRSQEPVPNAVVVLILGILSIITCWCYGILGIIFGAIALLLAKRGMNAYNEDPTRYVDNSYRNLKIGRVMAIVGLVLSVFILLLMVYIFIMHPEILDDAIHMLEERQKGGTPLHHYDSE